MVFYRKAKKKNTVVQPRTLTLILVLPLPLPLALLPVTAITRMIGFLLLLFYLVFRTNRKLTAR